MVRVLNDVEWAMLMQNTSFIRHAASHLKDCGTVFGHLNFFDILDANHCTIFGMGGLRIVDEEGRKFFMVILKDTTALFSSLASVTCGRLLPS